VKRGIRGGGLIEAFHVLGRRGGEGSGCYRCWGILKWEEMEEEVLFKASLHPEEAQAERAWH